MGFRRPRSHTFEVLVEKIHTELPDCRVYVLAIKPSPARWHLWPKMQEANRLLAEVCASDDRLTFIDIAGLMLDDNGQPKPQLYVKDRLHMTSAGYDIWRSVVRPILVQSQQQFELVDRADD